MEKEQHEDYTEENYYDLLKKFKSQRTALDVLKAAGVEVLSNCETYSNPPMRAVAGYKVHFKYIDKLESAVRRANTLAALDAKD